LLCVRVCATLGCNCHTTKLRAYGSCVVSGGIGLSRDVNKNEGLKDRDQECKDKDKNIKD